VHNPAIGEMLNVGVLMYAPSLGFIRAKFNHYYERLSNAFAGFDGDHYRQTIQNIEYAVEKLQTRHGSPMLIVVDPKLESVKDVADRIMPDKALSIQFGPMLAGVTDDLEMELDHIFSQAIISQYPATHKRRRDDDDVWQVYKKPLLEKRIARFLEPKDFVTREGFEFKFNHAFKNEKWHVLKPVNMDYANSHSIQDKATKVLGEATALNGTPELSTYYILLGEPRERSHKSAYSKAKDLLHRIPLKNEIIEEDGAEHFADYLSEYMKKHGIR
jgi:hypothetical protein